RSRPHPGIIARRCIGATAAAAACVQGGPASRRPSAWVEQTVGWVEPFARPNPCRSMLGLVRTRLNLQHVIVSRLRQNAERKEMLADALDVLHKPRLAAGMSAARAGKLVDHDVSDAARAR